MQKIKLSDVKISNMFKNSPPNERKMNRIRHNYIKYGVQDKPIVLDKDGFLVDGYARYLVLREFGEEYAKCVHKNNEIKKIPNYKRAPTYYIYGLHSGCDKEFVWRIPRTRIDEFVGKVIPGDSVLVNTKNGTRSIAVTKIELLNKPPIDKRIKKVIKVI